MKFLYDLVQNYGWAIILFTLLARVVMFPLSLKQQKSTARMSAYQPMIQELQKKWANDKARQQQEMQKFYEENKINMSAGCAPMLVNMLVLFGMIAVIQQPLTYIARVDAKDIENGVAIVSAMNPEHDINNSRQIYTQQSLLIDEVKKDKQVFLTGMEALDQEGNSYFAKMSEDAVDKIAGDNGFNFEFLKLNLAQAPEMRMNRYLIMPILSLLTMLGSQLIIMRTTPSMGGQGKTQMWMMTIVMGVMFGFYAFTVPVGFSLYYTVSNVVMTLQQLVLRKIYDPAKIREEVEAESSARRAAKKGKKKISVQDESGGVVSVDVSEAELMKMRLAKARELDAARYGTDSKDEKISDVVKKYDEERYGKSSPSKAADSSDDEEPLAEEKLTQTDEEPVEDESPSDEMDETPEDPAGESKEYKPGRRKRARMNKEETTAAEPESDADTAKENNPENTAENDSEILETDDATQEEA